jgi:hypothetical protein
MNRKNKNKKFQLIALYLGCIELIRFQMRDGLLNYDLPQTSRVPAAFHEIDEEINKN